MSAYTDAVAQRERENKSLLWIIFALIAVAFALTFAVWNLPRQMVVHVQPGLAARAVVRPGEVPKENVYAFSVLIFQQLNRWRTDGQKDYAANIETLKAFFTDGFRAQLVIDERQRRERSELQYRTRSVSLPPEVGYQVDKVQSVAAGEWIVYLDLELSENSAGAEIKNSMLRYPIRVVQTDVDSQYNPYGLLLDGFSEPARRLTAEELIALGKDATP